MENSGKEMSMLKRSFRFWILLLLAVSLVKSVSSQNVTISEELILRNDLSYSMIGWVGSEFLLFRDKGGQFFVQSFDKEMNLSWERQIDLPEQKVDIIGMVAHPDKFHLLYGVRTKGDYYLRHDVYSNELNLLDTITLDIIPDVFITPIGEMKSSEDLQQVAIQLEVYNGLRVYTLDLDEKETIRKFRIDLSDTNLSRDFRSLVVTNQGDFFLTLIEDKTNKMEQSLEVFSSVPETEELFQETVYIGDIQIMDFFPVTDNLHQNLVVTGFYSDRSAGRALGFYFLRYHPGESYVVQHLPLDDDLVSEVHGREVPASKGISDFTVQQVALRQDGGAVIIAELNKEFSRRSSLPMRRDNGTFSRSGWVDYYYEDLIVFAVHPDGTPHWKKVLRKRQYSQDDDAIYSSFFLFKSPEKLRLLFNDEIKQENTVGGYEVTGTGYVERKTVYNTDYQRLKLRFRDGVQVASNECIVPSERNNRLNLVRILFPE